MAATGTSFADGLRQHVALMLSFQHDGRGLPPKDSPFVFVAIALHLLVAGLVVLFLPNAEAPDEGRDFALQALWVVASYFFIARPLKVVEPMVGALLLSIVFDALRLVTGIFDLHTSVAMAVVSLWFLAAKASVFIRHYRRTITPPKNKKTNEKQ